MELSGIFITSMMVAFSGAMMPGPLLTVTISESHKKGFWAGPLIVLGHAMLELALVVALVFGFKRFFTSDMVVGVIGLLGGLFLLWMGSDMLRGAIKKTVSFEVNSFSKIKIGPVVAGIFVSISNPYWTIWWATIGVAYVLAALKFGILGLIFFFTAHILADLICYSAVSFMVVTGKRFLSERIYRVLISICGIFLILLAAYFIFSGLRFFLRV
ncbi:MAG TPA: lysine transporter LysE [Actinobacteria bacterium]|nr:lysine transporter LysE [Actinomycetota bacterium]